MAKVIILGSGAAPGVPALANGYGDCNPANPKNNRMRIGTYVELSGVKFLIDTSPDLRWQLLNNNIRTLDAVFYTHSHADHLHGIDDLREINRISQKAIDIFASKNNMSVIRERFGYLIADDESKVNPVYKAALRPNIFQYDKAFAVNRLKVLPIHLKGHNVESTGYIFNDGELVHIADFKEFDDNLLKQIKRRPELMIVPLTTPKGSIYHAGMDYLQQYAEKINPKRLIFNHMAVECDYDAVMARCTSGQEPAYDGMTIEWK